MNTAATPVLGGSRLAMIFTAKDRLPQRLKTLFDLLFVEGITEEQACVRLSMDREAILKEKTALIRSLKAASV